MVKHHPEFSLLAEYAAGNLDWAIGLAVSAHIQMCPQCRHEVDRLNTIGGAIVREQADNIEQSALDNSVLEEGSHTCSFERPQKAAFDTLMSKIKSIESENAQHPDKPQLEERQTKRFDNTLQQLPNVIQKLVDKHSSIKWKRVSPSLKMARLKTGQDKYELAFHKIGTGGKVAEHDHTGMEVTLVLNGSFSDGDGAYCEGDFLVRKPGDIHRPTATQNQDCLCFSVVESPVALTGLLGQLINPLLSIKPA